MSKLSNVVKIDVVKRTDYNAKITEIENKIPNINNLATKNVLNTVENKIPNTSGFVKKTDYNAKITDLENNIPDISNLATNSTALRFGSFSEKSLKKSTCTVMRRIIIAFRNQIFL